MPGDFTPDLPEYQLYCDKDLTFISPAGQCWIRALSLSRLFAPLCAAVDSVYSPCKIADVYFTGIFLIRLATACAIGPHFSRKIAMISNRYERSR